MTRLESEPMNYYESPYAISREEARDFGSLHLTPEEAHYIIMDSINNDAQINPDILGVLREIRDSDEGGDFASMVNSLKDDWG
jgi:hypothetical protein